MNLDKTIYSINFEDIQTVAEQEFDRLLTDKELEIIEAKIDNYFDWYEPIIMAIQDNIVNLEK